MGFCTEGVVDLSDDTSQAPTAEVVPPTLWGWWEPSPLLETQWESKSGTGKGTVEGSGGGVTRSYKEKANSNRPIGPYKAVRYLT